MPSPTLDLAALERLLREKQKASEAFAASDSMGDSMRVSYAEDDLAKAAVPVLDRLLTLAREAETLRGERDTAVRLDMEIKAENANLREKLAGVEAERDKQYQAMRVEARYRIDAEAALTALRAERERLENIQRDISLMLSEAGCNAMPIAEGVRWVLSERERLAAALKNVRLAIEDPRIKVLADEMCMEELTEIVDAALKETR